MAERHPDHEDHGHAFASKLGRRPDDRLRAAGFSIHSRPERGEPIWRNSDGTLLTQTEALAAVRGVKDEAAFVTR